MSKYQLFLAFHNKRPIWLIPKGTGAKRVSDYRSIALCNTHYKIIAKILSKRLQPLLQLPDLAVSVGLCAGKGDLR